MTGPTRPINSDRALRYVIQALDLLQQLEGVVSVPSAHVGTWVSLQRNLESAQVDLTPPTTEG